MESFLHYEYGDLAFCHFGQRLWIRNTLLHEDGDLYRLFRRAGVLQKDELPALLIRLYIYLRSKDGTAR